MTAPFVRMESDVFDLRDVQGVQFVETMLTAIMHVDRRKGLLSRKELRRSKSSPDTPGTCLTAAACERWRWSLQRIRLANERAVLGENAWISSAPMSTPYRIAPNPPAEAPEVTVLRPPR